MIYTSAIWRMCWFAEEISTSNFGDKRLSQRLLKMLQPLSESPASSVPEAMKSASETIAAYRFWGAERVTEAKILAPHRASTLKRIKGHQRVLALQDTSEFDYTTHESTSGLGYLESDQQFGIKYHPLLIASTEGVPQGLLQHRFWTRPLWEYGKKDQRHHKPIEEKESYRWLETVTYASSQIPAETEIVNIADREADIYELFALKRSANSRLLIRATHNRSLEDGSGTLFQSLQQVHDSEQIEVSIGHRKGQSSRKARLSLRYTRVCLASPQKKSIAPVELTAIEVHEPDPPDGSTPVRGVLLTDLEVNSSEDLFTYVR